jgi:hypothetical protein
MRMPVHNLIKNNTRYRGAYAGSLKKQRRFTVCTAGRDSDIGALQGRRTTLWQIKLLKTIRYL